MKVTVYQSEYTGELFTTLSAYNKHVAKHKKMLEEQRIKSEQYKKIQEARDSYRRKVSSCSDFETVLIEAIKNELGEEHFNNLGLILNVSVGFSPSISNSHSCPIGGIKNWSRDPSLPFHYPGWSGSITFSISDEGSSKEQFDIISKIKSIIEHIPGFNTGNGGHRNIYERRGAHYDLRLYLDDFPKLKKIYRRVDLMYTDYVKYCDALDNEIEKETSISLHPLDQEISSLRKELNDLVEKREEKYKELVLKITKSVGQYSEYETMLKLINDLKMDMKIKK